MVFDRLENIGGADRIGFRVPGYGIGDGDVVPVDRRGGKRFRRVYDVAAVEQRLLGIELPWIGGWVAAEIVVQEQGVHGADVHRLHLPVPIRLSWPSVAGRRKATK